MSKEYRDTLNLPETDLSMKAGLPKRNQKYFHFGTPLIYIKKLESRMLEKKNSFFMMGLPTQMETFISDTPLIKP